MGLALVLAACGGDRSISTAPPPVDPPSVSGPSALHNPGHPALPEPLVDLTLIVAGGPPPDGIPSIDDPTFVPVPVADVWLADAEPVVVLTVGDDTRVYPVQVLIWHEIVNDTVGGVPVAVTYCPLCNSAVSFERIVGGVENTFGTSGMLFASALVMYDRATESLWTHFDGRAVAGVLAGNRLQPMPSPLLAWRDAKRAFPDAGVLDRHDTGHAFPYGENPYAGYDNPNSSPRLYRGTLDERAPAKQRVVGVALGGDARAWTLDSVSGGAARVTHSAVGDRPVVIFWTAGQASAIDSLRIVSGRDVGSTGVFLPIVDGRTLTFEADGDEFVDTDTGTRWDITGQALDGELAGTRLERIPHLDTFWFAWSTYQPNTDLIETPG